MTRGATARRVASVAFEGVWLDDRRRCRWALRGLDLVADAGSLVAVLGDADEGGADGVLDLLAGRRAPNNGRVVVDGVDLRELDARTHRASVVELELRPGGERRLCLGDGTMLAARPSPATLAAADLVVVLEDGLEVARGTLRPARAS